MNKKKNQILFSNINNNKLKNRGKRIRFMLKNNSE